MKWNPTQDGVTHLNVYSKGRTELGRMLSNFHQAPFTTSKDGEFHTVEGYWYWLSCHDDRLRRTNGWDSKKLGRELRAADWNQDPQFKEKICSAIRCKVLQHAEIANALRASTLPFAHYYVYGSTVVAVKEGVWILECLETLRRELKAR